MTREQRERDLAAILQRGMPALLDEYRRVTGMPQGQCPEPGTPLVQAILEHEFPPETK